MTINDPTNTDISQSIEAFDRITVSVRFQQIFSIRVDGERS